MAKTRSLRERFEEKYLIDPSGCWLWQAAKNQSGYGFMMGLKRVPLLAHRVSYELNVGEIPRGMHVLHKCDTPNCVAPYHLFIGDDADNVADKVAKNRQQCGVMVHKAKLTDSMAMEIFLSDEKGDDLAKKYNVVPSVISEIRNKKAWKHIHG